MTCRFQTRCPHAMDICREVVPAPFLTPDALDAPFDVSEGPILFEESRAREEDMGEARGLVQE